MGVVRCQEGRGAALPPPSPTLWGCNSNMTQEWPKNVNLRMRLCAAAAIHTHCCHM